MRTIQVFLYSLLALLAAAYSALSADVAGIAPEKPEKAFAAKQFTVSPFTGLTLSDGEGHGRQFTGLGIGYHITDAVAITAEGAASDLDQRFIDQFGSHFRGYLPIGNSGLAAYGEIGYQRFTRDDLNFMSTGVGFEIRATKYFGGFVGARWLSDFKSGGEGQVLLGANFRF